METKIDIPPGDPIPTPSVGPLDQDCSKEGLIVCDREKINGQQGTSLDTLVRICTRLGSSLEEIGIINSYSLAERIKAMAEDVHPLLAEVRGSGLIRELENLTQNLTQASDDLRRVHASIMTPENTELIHRSINTLSFTLQNIEVLLTYGTDLYVNDLVFHDIVIHSSVLHVLVLMVETLCLQKKIKLLVRLSTFKVVLVDEAFS
ncbi:unnamed protein product [Sphenostylis stenocarpa]|uniref:Uncharacterized protein n=1 Tax=Sphenostylis stenocarpa TaxID=92480 RepID=A0AA86VRZ5_9FABA|nr:unnamed protein product [Sphenostylis stenocarpa]